MYEQKQIGLRQHHCRFLDYFSFAYMLVL